MAKALSPRQRLLNQIKYAGTQSDRQTFTRLLLNNRISREVAELHYLQGVNLKKFILNRDLLSIKKVGEKNEPDQNEAQRLPARQNCK